MRDLVVIVTSILLSVTPTFAKGSTKSKVQHSTRPKNIIIMIADGWGINQIKATNYWFGIKNQSYQNFPFAHWMSTWSLALDTTATGKKTVGREYQYVPTECWKSFNWMFIKPTDSAAAATAMSTGVKTFNNMVGTTLDSLDFKSVVPLKNALEVAEAHGMATGVVTTVQFWDATPAGFSVHDSARSNDSAITRKLIEDSQLEVVLGCSHPLFDDNGKPVDPGKANYKVYGDSLRWRKLVKGEAGGDCDGDGVSDPFKFIESRAEFQAIASGSAPKRLFGVPQVKSATQYLRDGASYPNSHEEPYHTKRLESVPTLSEMSRAALNVLYNNRNGFYLMIEGGAVDRCGHANLLGREIEEMADFNEAVESVIRWVERDTSKNGWDETLLIVTGDHECGGLWGYGCKDSTWVEIGDNGQGKMPDFYYYTGHHTNALIPFFAKGAGIEKLEACLRGHDPRRGSYLDNTDLGRVTRELISGE